jgi:hypothetical protein
VTERFFFPKLTKRSEFEIRSGESQRSDRHHDRLPRVPCPQLANNAISRDAYQAESDNIRERLEHSQTVTDVFHVTGAGTMVDAKPEIKMRTALLGQL